MSAKPTNTLATFGQICSGLLGVVFAALMFMWWNDTFKAMTMLGFSSMYFRFARKP